MARLTPPADPARFRIRPASIAASAGARPRSPERFAALAKQGHNPIPYVCEVLADLDTTLSCHLKLASARYSYLFESVQGGEKRGRYSIIGLPCRTVLKV